MGEETNLSLICSSSDGCNFGISMMLACMVLSWIFIHVWYQRKKRGPKTWPLVGAAIEQFMNYDRMHDWLVNYLSESKTVVVPMPFTTYTYIADPACSDHGDASAIPGSPSGFAPIHVVACHDYNRGKGKRFKSPVYSSLNRNHYMTYDLGIWDPKGILEDDVLPDGTKVKAGGMVTYVPYSMGRMEYNWGPDAASFKPERWLKDGFFQNATPFKFTAFQAGPRICLGKDSAYLQMKIALAILCRFYKFTLVPGHPVKYRMMTILSMAHGLKLTLSRRS